MFQDLYRLLQQDDHFNVSDEIEILKGLFHKINTPSDIMSKGKRKRKFKK